MPIEHHHEGADGRHIDQERGTVNPYRAGRCGTVHSRSAATVGAGDWVDPAVWALRDMRLALARHEIGTAFRLLQRFGVSQRRIAARTEQAQGEVSEIITGRRRVASYDLLLRVAAGLVVPRGWLGLAYDTDTYDLLVGAQS
jgi:hypothetical protein